MKEETIQSIKEYLAGRSSFAARPKYKLYGHARLDREQVLPSIPFLLPSHFISSLFSKGKSHKKAKFRMKDRRRKAKRK